MYMYNSLIKVATALYIISLILYRKDETLSCGVQKEEKPQTNHAMHAFHIRPKMVVVQVQRPSRG